jgi:2-succinyl-5-enolpyruvyl-6-hydroxy-3-cyclohexene-1-carboxylate synthase
MMTAPAHDMHVLLRAFCEELARCGMTDACTSPGSRSAPLVLALAREPGLRTWSHVDERCAGFFAVGLAKATGRPAAVAVTSGTAAAELAPAVHEAREARVPMVVLTADRPPELRNVGAGQTIDQVELYGRAAKWFFEVGDHEASAERVAWMRALACRAYWTALEGRPGAVHLNFPLREPLVPGGPVPEPRPGRPGRAPWRDRAPARAAAEPESLERLAGAVRERSRGAIVCGRWERDRRLGGVVAAFAEATGYPVLADPLSGARLGGSVAAYDALLRDQGFAAARVPELVLRIGDLPTSKPLRAWLAGPAGSALHVGLDPEGVLHDPEAVLDFTLAADPAAVLAELSALTDRAADAEWIEAWRRADRAASAALDEALGDALSEPRVAAELGHWLPGEATLFVASSMPIRDVETFFPARDAPPRVLSNRGANGIDGTVSSALGAAAAGAGPVVLLIGDVALAHDVGGLLAVRRLGLELKVVLLDNGGGGIFDFLPIAGEADVFEQHVATPTGLDFAKVAAAYGLAHRLVTTTQELRAGLGEPGAAILEVRGDRTANVALHRAAWERVSAALR